MVAFNRTVGVSVYGAATPPGASGMYAGNCCSGTDVGAPTAVPSEASIAAIGTRCVPKALMPLAVQSIQPTTSEPAVSAPSTDHAALNPTMALASDGTTTVPRAVAFAVTVEAAFPVFPFRIGRIVAGCP